MFTGTDLNVYSMLYKEVTALVNDNQNTRMISGRAAGDGTHLFWSLGMWCLRMWCLIIIVM